MDGADGVRDEAVGGEGLLPPRGEEMVLSRKALRQGVAGQEIESGALAGGRLALALGQVHKEDVPVTGRAGGAAQVAQLAPGSLIGFGG